MCTNVRYHLVCPRAKMNIITARFQIWNVTSNKKGKPTFIYFSCVGYEKKYSVNFMFLFVKMEHEFTKKIYQIVHRKYIVVWTRSHCICCWRSGENSILFLYVRFLKLKCVCTFFFLIRKIIVVCIRTNVEKGA